MSRLAGLPRRSLARVPALRWAVAAALLLGVPALACAQDADTASANTSYERAIATARGALERAPADAGARRALARLLLEAGRYADAEATAREGNGPALSNTLGEILLAQGKLPEAEASFRLAVERAAPDRLGAELNLATLLLLRGERDEAFRRFDRFIDVYNNSTALSAADLTAVGSAVRQLGARDPQLFQDALKAFDEAIAADPGDPEPRLRLGELFLEKYNSAEAQETFRAVLAVNPSSPRALLGLARAREFDGETGEAFELVRRALRVSPSSVPARIALARLHLDHEDTRVAEAELQKALAVNPSSPEALAALAGIRYVLGDQPGFRQIRDRVLRLYPSHADFYGTVAEIAARYRRYADAATLAQEAVTLDPEWWTGYGVLGLNQLRAGRVDDARRSLERSFEGDPYNVWIKNTLDLLDTYPQYQVRKTPHFEFLLHGDEADLLYPYMAELAEEAYEKLSRRYGYRPETPVRLEVYPRHADFSVRTVGLAGLGALGVSFGNVLAMDSPKARDAGDLNGGSTLWHELTHAVTLGLSQHRVPRWLTEGLSVLEERRARPGWGSEAMPAFLSAYFEGELPPLSRLNEGFIRPRSPQHVGHAYHMASLAVEWIEATRGFDAITRMLRSYGAGESNEQALRGALRMEPEAIDRAFDAWLRARFDPKLLTDLAAAESAAERLIQEGKVDEAQRHLERAVQILPEYAAAGRSPLAMLAQIHLRRGNTREAASALTRLTARDENAYAENLKLAELLEQLGDTAGAAAALQRAVYIYPYELALHTRLAELYGRAGNRAGVVRERGAIVALAPVDRAEALYQLAVALDEAGDRAGARREVLRALEVAPGFERAQELLLRVRGTDPSR